MRRAVLLAAWAAALLPVPSAAGSSTGTVHIASFRRTHYTLDLPLVDALESLLEKEGVAGVDAESVASHFNGEEYMFRVPASASPGLGEPVGIEVEVFETAGGYLLLPAAQSAFVERFGNLVADRGFARARRGRVLVAATPMEDGSVIRSVKFGAGPGAEAWQNTLALTYGFQTREGPVEAVFLYKTLGGEGRTASALLVLRARFGKDLLVLNRGEIFAVGASVTTGTLAGRRFETMGVDAALVGLGELSRLGDLMAYRGSGGGLVFLSANLIDSEPGSGRFVEPVAEFAAGGLKVGVLGLTRPGWIQFLDPNYADRFTLADPVETAKERVPDLRRELDVVVVLSNLTREENARLRAEVPGIDLIVGDSFPFDAETGLPGSRAEDPDRGPFDRALAVTGDWPSVLSHATLERRARADGRVSLSASEEHLLLDRTYADLDGFVKFKPESFGGDDDPRAPLLPSVRNLFSGMEGFEVTRLPPRNFWNLASSLAAARTRSEAGVLTVGEIYGRTTGDISERRIREFFAFPDTLVAFELKGSDLKKLVAAADRGGLDPSASGIPVAAGGIEKGGLIHGVAIDPAAVYRVAGSGRLLSLKRQFPFLSGASRISSHGNLSDAIISELRLMSDQGASLDEYRALLSGRPLRRSGFWRVNFRDVSLTASNTKVVTDPAFANVSNARVTGFDELLFGAVSKIDLEYFRGPYKWTNAFEVEYSRSVLRPPGRPKILNTPKNRSSWLSVGTVRVGSFPLHWMARSYGPSLGAQYEGDVERLPLQRRKHVMSLYPGVELFGGSPIRSIAMSGNIRRDFTPEIPVNKYGFRGRVLYDSTAGPGRLQGELTSNYFIRTPHDTDQDLRLELNAVAKLHLPVWKNLSFSPFIDFYYFILKVRPVTGYSAITGISLGFTRIWKPQYESF